MIDHRGTRDVFVLLFPLGGESATRQVCCRMVQHTHMDQHPPKDVLVGFYVPNKAFPEAFV